MKLQNYYQTHSLSQNKGCFAEMDIEASYDHENSDSNEQNQKQKLTTEALSHDSSANNSKTHKIGFITFSLTKSKKTTNLIKFLNDRYNSLKAQSEDAKMPTQGGLEHSSQKSGKQGLCLEDADLVHYHSVIQSEQEKFVLRKSGYKKSIPISERYSYIGHLSKITFKFMKHLDVSSCKLSTIEGLSFLDIPMIQRLEIQNNHIRNLNVLNKCQFKNLKYISFYQNPILQFQLAFRGKMPKLTRIIADSDRIQNDLTRQQYKNKADQNSLYHIDPIFKSQNLFNMIELKMNTRKRILPQKFKQALRAINPQIKLKNKLTNEDLMNRLERLGGIGTRNDPIAFRRFLDNDVQPVLRDRERNPNHIFAINQIRQGLWQRLRQLEEANQRANRPEDGNNKNDDNNAK